MTKINPESRLRKLGRECGLDIQRARKKPGEERRFQITEIDTGRVVAGEGFKLTIRSVAVELQRRHILGR